MASANDFWAMSNLIVPSAIWIVSVWRIVVVLISRTGLPDDAAAR